MEKVDNKIKPEFKTKLKIYKVNFFSLSLPGRGTDIQ